jgi:hypothetical protein
LAKVAVTFSCRPSQLLAIADPVEALMLDLAATRRVMDLERGATDGADGPTERLDF